MKLITAIIQNDKMDDVREALIAAGITRITVSRVAGHGRQADEEIYRGQSVVPNLIPKTRIEIACNDDFVQKSVDAIVEAAQHENGAIGDDKIFVTPLEECIRIRTKERGSVAI